MIKTTLLKLVGITAAMLVAGVLLYGCAQKRPCQQGPKEPEQTEPAVQKAPAQEPAAPKAQPATTCQLAKNAKTIFTEMFETYRNARTLHVKGQMKMIYNHITML